MNPWNTLGVSKDASPEDIKQAYRKLAMKYHPDRGGDTKKFQEIQTAYADITSGRAEQESQSHNNFNWAGFGPGFNGQPFGFTMHRKMEDLSVEYSVSLEDMYYGKSEQIRIATPDRSSYIHLDVNITPGMASNSRIRYPGAASNNMSGIIPGDVFILLSQKSHHTFRRHGDDLSMEQEISIFDAMLGSDINIKTMGGKELTMRVPPGAKPGLRLRVSGAGMPKPNGSRNYGDLYVQLNIKVPTLKKEDLDKKLIDIINENK
jgi:curved DNA-binding protein